MFKSYLPHASPGHHPAKINWQSIANSVGGCVSLSIRLAPSLMGLYSEWPIELSHLQARPYLCTSLTVAGTMGFSRRSNHVSSNRGWPGVKRLLVGIDCVSSGLTHATMWFLMSLGLICKRSTPERHS